MYTEFFQLREMPFSITPDPAYLYMSPRHQEALGHLLYGTGQYGGFVQLTGEVGTGKTTIVRTLLEQKLPNVDVAMIHNPRQSEQEFVQTICDELGAEYVREGATLKTLVDALNEHLLRTHAAGHRTVLIIDEAQNLQPSVLEQVRLLTNLETAKEKLLRIMLIGQPELSVLLARPDLRQLSSRITARYHLMPLSAQETREYVEHRLRVAGCHAEIFQPRALALVHKYSRGVPRLINIICDRALLGAYAEHARTVSAETVRKAAREAIGALPQVFDPRAPVRWRWIETAWFAALIACSALFFYSYTHDEPLLAAAQSATRSPAPPPPPASVVPVPAALAPSDADAAPAPLLMPRLPVASIGDLDATVQPLSIVMGRLIRLWEPRLVVPRGENVCSALRVRALECYRTRGSWSDLKQMDRPAILTLDLPAAGEQHFLLLELGQENAVLDTVLGPIRVPLAELDQVWAGDFLLLWRRQTEQSYIGPGSSGADIATLWRRLAEIDGVAAPATIPSTFDSRLGDALTRFQSERGLINDGVAGIRTLIALSDGLPNTPSLTGVGP